MRYFDLILVYTSHRRHNNYINICKYLSPHKSIGIIYLPDRSKRWWNCINTENTYVQKCLDYGAKLIEVGSEAGCHSLMISRFGKGKQRGYYEDIIEDIPKLIKYKRVLVNFDSYMDGHPCMRDILKTFKPVVLLIPYMKFFASHEPDTIKAIDEHFQKGNPVLVNNG